MKKPKQKKELRTIAVRLPEELIAEMEALKPMIQASPEYYSQVSVSIAGVTRMAILAGLETLKQRFSA